MSPAEVLDAIRDLVIAAEEQGWDALSDLKPVLDRGRDAYADMQIVMADADDHMIAAAPDILAALKSLVEYAEGNEDPEVFPEEHFRLNSARAAIAEAEGGAS